jgi:LysM domain-containing protein
MRHLSILGTLVLGFSIGSIAAAPAVSEPVVLNPVVLNPGHPDSYTVQQGDTLWDITGHFLRDPWRWPEVWRSNPQIKNPNLIYPGDTLTLDIRDGRAEIRKSGGHPTVRLSPEVRIVPLPRPIPTVPIDVIRPFLIQPLVLNQREQKGVGYIVANTDNRLISGTGDKVYARGISEFDHTRFSVFRPGRPLLDYGSRKVLGYEAVYVADTELASPGSGPNDVATLTVRDAAIEVHPGDRVMPVSEEEFQENFLPQPPAVPVEGRIIAIPGGSSRIGRLQAVVIDRGYEDGMRVGDVLAVYQAGARIIDPVTGRTVKLPDQRAGLLMLFRLFGRVSYGLVMETQREMRLYDVVTNPD